MTDWEVEALNEDEAFFHLKSIFSCFVNTLAFVLFFLFCLKPSYIYSLSVYCFLGEGEKLCV